MLRDRWVPIRLLRGLDAGDEDDKTLQPGTPTRLENCVFTSPGRIEKRHGEEPLGVRREGDTYAEISGALGGCSRDDEQEMVLLTTTDEVVARSSDGRWLDHGDWVDCQVSVDPLPRGPAEMWDPSMAQVGDTRLVAWEDARGGVRARFFDPSGVALSREFPIAGHVSRAPRVHAVAKNFVVFFVSGSQAAPTFHDFSIAATKTSSPSGSYTTLATDIRPGDYQTRNPTYDAVAGQNVAYVTWPVSGALAWYAAILPNGHIGLSGTFPSYPDPQRGMEWLAPSIALSSDGKYLGLVGQQATTRNIFAFMVKTADLSPYQSSVTLERTGDLGGNYGVRRLTCGFEDLGSNAMGDPDYRLHVLTELSSSDVVDRRIRHATYDVLAGTVTSGSFLRHSSLASKPFVLGGTPLAWVSHLHPLQSTDFLVRVNDGLVCARSRYGLARTDVSGVLSNVDVQGTVGTRGCQHLDRLALPDTSGSTFQGRHVRLQSVDYHPSSSWRPVDVDGVLHFPGGWLGMYDGVQVVEHGFALNAEVPVITVGSASLGSNLGVGADTGSWVTTRYTGSYLYAVVPEWPDARGNIHRGAPLGFATASLSASSSGPQNTASLSIRTMQHTMKDGVRAQDINFAVYRSGPNSTVLQRVGQVVNQTGSDRVTFNDTVADGVRRQGEVLYTQVEDPNVMVSSPRHLALAGDRLYAGDLDGARGDIQISKLRLGGAVAFTDAARVSVDPVGGQLTALAAMDDRVVAFKRGRIFADVARGPESNLSADTAPYGQGFQLVTSDVGCVEGGPVEGAAGTTMQGLFFRSERGIRMLDRGLSVRPIGFGVRDFDDLTATGIHQSPGTEQLRFHTAEGTTLVLDLRYEQPQWSTFPAQHSVGSFRWRGRSCRVASDGVVWAERSGSYLDGGSTYQMVIELAWLEPSGLQNDGRIRGAQLLGEYISPHFTDVEWKYDYRDEYVFRQTVCTTASLDLSPYGGPDEVGGGFPYGSDLAPSFLSCSSLTASEGPTSGVTFAFVASVWDAVLGSRASGSATDALTLMVHVTDSASLDTPVTVQDDTWLDIDTLTTSSREDWVLLRVFNANGAGNPSDVTGWMMEQAILSGSSLITVTGRDLHHANARVQVASDIINAGTFVSGTDAGGNYGSQDPVYQHYLGNRWQRTQAVGLRISDRPITYRSGSLDAGGSFHLTELSLKVATEPRGGNSRLPTRKRH